MIKAKAIVGESVVLAEDLKFVCCEHSAKAGETIQFHKGKGWYPNTAWVLVGPFLHKVRISSIREVA